MMPESPSSPDTHTQGLEVVMALLSFLMGMITTLYGITAGEQNMSAPEQRNKHQHANVWLANWVDFIMKSQIQGKHTAAEKKQNNRSHSTATET